MARFTRSDDLQGAEFDHANLKEARFVEVSLRGARFVSSDLSGIVMRGVDVQGTEIDSPWLLEDGGVLRVNGIDVTPYVDAELNRQFPGRDSRHAQDPPGLQAGWEQLQRTWGSLLERVAAMPAGTVDISIDGEWSFAQTLRHLVMATDTWLGRAILRTEQPYHPIGQPHAGAEEYGLDMSPFMTRQPSYDEVLEARADRVAMMRDYLANVTPDELAAMRTSAWDPDHEQSVLSCLHVIFDEEWEHYRYAVRDVDALAAKTP